MRAAQRLYTAVTEQAACPQFLSGASDRPGEGQAADGLPHFCGCCPQFLSGASDRVGEGQAADGLQAPFL